MVSGINSDISQLQILRATQAFKKAVSSSQKLDELINNEKPAEIDDRVNVTSTPSDLKINVARTEGDSVMKNQVMVNEVKKYATKYGHYEISDEDINYAFKYGRSVLVNQMV